jgi:hypothetical protein
MLFAIPRVVKLDLVVEHEMSWWTTENAPVRARNDAEIRMQNEASRLYVMVTNKSINNVSRRKEQRGQCSKYSTECEASSRRVRAVMRQAR